MKKQHSYGGKFLWVKVILVLVLGLILGVLIAQTKVVMLELLSFLQLLLTVCVLALLLDIRRVVLTGKE